ncbi:MAG TPA: NAD-dependent deacylase [Kiritimatiellia bacterium]|nr:NAD-dependent deacylase [Kiritimatiellia bacterium]HRZ13288.1 NAD-dependent deacylase [Kiritimatiellia bacterium]HSA18737.1 NAD-dependent deacylase [Kiritimatiellia bacterium]
MKGADAIRETVERVGRARRIAALTGAGISTPSGIPDFRSADGLYADERNANVFDIGEFHRRPEHFYRFAREFYPMLQRAQPNAAHRALAAWEREGKEVHIATQNIDDLHQRAGSTRVYPVHGTVETSACQDCGVARRTSELVPEVMTGRVPRCGCGGVFKPDITFFGEMLPEEAWNRSVEAMHLADLVLVIGTSLAVYPAASLPDQRRPAAALIVVNRDPTPLDGAADVVLRGDLAEVFGRLEVSPP